MITETDIGLSRKRGRPKLGNVLFARRVKPAMVPLLMDVLLGKSAAGSDDESELRSQVRLLLDDVDRLEGEKRALEERLDHCSRSTDDEKARYWMGRYEELKASLLKGEFDQT